MTFEKPPRLRGVSHLLAKCCVGYGIKGGDGEHPNSQRAPFRDDCRAGSRKNLECLEMIVVSEISEIRKR
jgi:hypothetical protein